MNAGCPADTGESTLRAITRAAEFIANADCLLITAGAGMGVDSGFPDFRGGGGFWRAYPPLKALGLSFEQMAQPRWFAEKPEMAWAWYGHRQQLYRDTAPHAGYALLRAWGRTMTVGTFVLTSNVDGHFFRAGFPENGVVEQHGSIHRLQCTRPCSRAIWPSQTLDLHIDLSVLRAAGELPRCPQCRALARPNVLMFDDDTWISDVTDVQQARFADWLSSVQGKNLVIIECGAGTAIATIRMTGERIAARWRAPLVRINPDVSESESAAIALRLPALHALGLIEQALPERFRQRCGS